MYYKVSDAGKEDKMDLGRICLQVTCAGSHCVQEVLSKLLQETGLKPRVLTHINEPTEEFAVGTHQNRILFSNVPQGVAQRLILHARLIEGVAMDCDCA